jgi:hypothetical protein
VQEISSFDCLSGKLEWTEILSNRNSAASKFLTHLSHWQENTLIELQAAQIAGLSLETHEKTTKGDIDFDFGCA